MPDNTTRIAELTEVIEAGATFVGVDGQQITTDLDMLERVRRDLIATDTSRSGERPRVTRIDLSNL